jgi:hypothetical protein
MSWFHPSTEGKDRIMKRHTVALAVAALLVPALLGLTARTASANTPSASIHILNQAQLVAGGIDVTVDYNCASSSTNSGGSIGVGVSQNFMNSFGGATATCDDKTHQTTVFVAGPFTPGTANAGASVASDDASSFGEQSTEITIK